MALRKGAIVAFSGLALLGASSAFTQGRPGANGVRLPAEREAASVKDRLRGLSAEQLRADAPQDSEGFGTRALAVGLALGLAAGVLGAPAARAADLKELDREATALATKLPNKEIKKTLQKSKAQEFIENEANKGTELRMGGVRTAVGGNQGNVIKNSKKARAPSSNEFFGSFLPSVNLPLPALPALPALAIPESVLGVALGAAITLGVPALAAGSAVLSRIEEKKREEAARIAREANDPTGTILAGGAALAAAFVLASVLTSAPAVAPPAAAP
eukprot:CAMPEP_0203872926 /NCGR_PEP_ID=MMETSP0359-20131031/19489_1 /ASSEMBLY_ACC=CAM_ASM_000338 /TAXON_ID=268821 /ORGANISM="Scrippsiella Hangoei, Strain SHTV-5" /LENGTH=273 /DNA_ID=CAMNT_0050791617 /DNA_START=69 /DNA_END=886 /DNA_ORIENTATION=+